MYKNVISHQSFHNFLDELKELNLPKGKYAIFGSGPIAIRGLRDAHDLDVIVKNSVYQDLCNRYSKNVVLSPVNCIQLNNLEITNIWLNSREKINEMIDTAETIQGFPFVRLKYLLKYKKQMGRKKDLEDIKLVKKYLKNSK